jgi:hypothetical protein
MLLERICRSDGLLDAKSSLFPSVLLGAGVCHLGTTQQ